MDITTNELIAELQQAARAADAPDGSITSTEIREVTGWGYEKTLTVLKKLLRDGKARAVKSWRPRIDGQANKVTAYVFTSRKAAKR